MTKQENDKDNVNIKPQDKVMLILYKNENKKKIEKSVLHFDTTESCQISAQLSNCNQ